MYLVYTELHYYWHETDIVYQFQPDMSLDDQVQMHVDITVAMPCASLSGVDLMDETQQDVFAYGTLQREGVWWEMNDHDRLQFQAIQIQNQYLREEFHSLADVLFKDIMRDTHPQRESPSTFPAAPPPPGALPVALDFHMSQQAAAAAANPETKYDACRLHGTLGINKVAGVLHLVGGAQPVVGLFEDHWMIELRRMPANFTHRINRLSFGQYSRRIVQPLEGDETIIQEEATTVQYFLKVVPTEIRQTFSTINTFQYSVTENVRKLGESLLIDGNYNSNNFPFSFRFREELVRLAGNLFQVRLVGAEDSRGQRSGSPGHVCHPSVLHHFGDYCNIGCDKLPPGCHPAATVAYVCSAAVPPAG